MDGISPASSIAFVIAIACAAALTALIVVSFQMRRRAQHCKQDRWKSTKCTSCSGSPDAKWGFLMDPMHNIKEVVRNCALLEIHLAKERCVDCITKHALIISGLIDEGICLANDPAYRSMPYVRALRACADDMADIERGLFNASDTPVETAYKLRTMRKKLMPIINGAIDAKAFDAYPAFDPHVCSCAASTSRAVRNVSANWFTR